MKLTPHQKKIIGALLALETQHDWHWWSCRSIGRIVQAGGRHSTIQTRTMRLLFKLGLVITQAHSWTEESVDQVRCGCATYHWGLTDAGRTAAGDLTFRLPEETRQRLASCGFDAINFTSRGITRINEDKDWWHDHSQFDDDEDD